MSKVINFAKLSGANSEHPKHTSRYGRNFRNPCICAHCDKVILESRGEIAVECNGVYVHEEHYSEYLMDMHYEQYGSYSALKHG